MSTRNSATAATFVGGARELPVSAAGRLQYNQTSRYICTCVRDFLIASIIALTLIALISVISSLFIRPRTPRFTVVSTAADVSVNSTGSEFKAACNLSLLATNPNNNLVIWYKRLDVLLLYGSDYQLSEARFRPTFQKKHTQSVISAHLVSDDLNVDNDVVKGLASELRRGVVTFRVRILALVRFKRGKWLTRSYNVKADCNGVDIGFNRTGMGNLVEPSRDCEEYLSKNA